MEAKARFWSSLCWTVLVDGHVTPGGGPLNSDKKGGTEKDASVLDAGVAV